MSARWGPAAPTSGWNSSATGFWAWLFRPCCSKPSRKRRKANCRSGWPILSARKPVAAVAREWGLGDALRLGEGEQRSGAKKRDAILGDCCEAVIGAVYCDGGLAAAEILVRAVGRRACMPLTVPKDAKTLLQEIVQARGLPVPTYRDVGPQGAGSCPVFEVRCRCRASPRFRPWGRPSAWRNAPLRKAGSVPPGCGRIETTESSRAVPVAPQGARGSARMGNRMSEPEAETPTRCGFVALIGVPNAGKSTLLNQLVGPRSRLSAARSRPRAHRSVALPWLAGHR